MFYYISGGLALLDINTAVVDAGGVGYRLTVSQTTYNALPRPAQPMPQVRLYTYMAVREDAVELFGEGLGDLGFFLIGLGSDLYGDDGHDSFLLTLSAFQLYACADSIARPGSENNPTPGKGAAPAPARKKRNSS